MKLEQTSYSIDNIIPLKESVIEYLRYQNSEESTVINDDEEIQGGILSDIRYSWLAKGPKLEVLHTKTGAKVSAWCFRAQHDFETSITCVVDLGSEHGKAPLLVVGLYCEITGGMVCVFDVGSSRVLRAVQIDDQVTSIEVVNAGFDSSLPGVLRALDGIIAVGTAKGKVLLVDLCRQVCEEALVNSYNETIRDEINPCHLMHLEYDDLRNLERYKEESLRQGKHLCLQLNESSTTSTHFTLYGPSGDVRLRANKSEVVISCLHFSPALGSLLVGYNFGAWQLYTLVSSPTSAPLLAYTSPMYEDCLPVGHFAVQEPCDDPRAFCYVWAAYSLRQRGDAGATIAVMYALTYEGKEELEGYGWLYQGLVGCAVRFQVEMGKVVDKGSQNTGAKCLSLRSYTRPLTSDSPDERLALCVLVWSCWEHHAGPGAAPHVYLAVFDLNQWYKEQMPAQPRAALHDNERYIACVSVTEMMAGGGGGVLDIRVDPTSISPFICPSRLDEHYYPSSLAFRGLVLSPRQLGWLRSAGSQRHLLAQLELAGPLCLLQPADLYHRCVALGLCPAHAEQGSVGGRGEHGQQRRVVLSVALEHQLVRWLCRCARDWANGSQSSGGCTLDLLLEWAWQRANALKFSADQLCVPLFDHSGQRLDRNALLQLNHDTCQLKHLTTLFGTVVRCCKQYFTTQDLDDIHYQWRSLQMISIYLDVLQWLLNVGLLPECPLSMYPLPDDSVRMSAPYPVDSLARYYSERRAELRRDGDDDDAHSLLFIDQLLQTECGGSTLSKQWQCDGGTGLYPPPSLQALLRTYLVEDIGIENKHCLFIYVFLDLAMTLDQSRYKSIITHLIKFPAVFLVSPSVIKITQAFWQLDHGDFSTAMAQLLDPAVAGEDLQPWHHRTVLQALLLQGQHQHALLYQQVRKPPVSSVQDICMVITLLVVNDLLQEAFHFQRQNRSVYNEKEILKHFFTVSDEMNKLRTILQFPLSSSEEDAVISYLRAHSTEQNQKLQVLYYLQRDRYEDAFRGNDEQNACSGRDYRQALRQGLLGQQERDFRNVAVEGFNMTLPEVTRTLLENLKDGSDADVWVEVDNVLQPFSTVMHNIFKEIAYNPTLIHASIQKAKETWTKCVKNKDRPFISAPRVVPELDKRNETPLIYASIMQPHSDTTLVPDPESEATPAKRMRLSPRQPISSNMRASLQRRSRLSTNSSATIGVVTSTVESPSLSLLDTPIVKRKSYRETEREDGRSPVPSVVGTPTSILKVRSFIRKSRSPDVGDVRGTSTTPELLEEDQAGDGDEPELDVDSGVVPLDQSTADAIKSVGMNIAKKMASNISISKEHHRSPLVSPRRAIQRTPRQAVRFEQHARPGSRGSSASDTSTGAAPGGTQQHLQVSIDVHREHTPQSDHEHDHSGGDSNEEVFYSPNETFEENVEETDKDAEVCTATPTKQVHQVDQPSLENSAPEKVSLKRKANDSSIKSRRSYKTDTPVTDKDDRNIRESLRSRDSLNKSKTPSLKSVESTINSLDSAPKIVVTSEDSTPRKVFPKISGRRSVSPSPKIVVASGPGESTPKQNEVYKLGAHKFVAAPKTEESSPKKEVYSKLRGRRSVEPAAIETTEKTKESSPRKGVFPKVAGRRSLSRLVLEHNALARAFQQPKMQTRLSMTKIPENTQTVGVEVSYSKTVTSIVKKTSDTVTEEKCDKSTVEMKNVFTTEKDSSTQMIKHVHNESSSKSSLKKVTEVLNESSDHEENNLQSHDTSVRSNFLTSSSDIDDSVFHTSYQPSEQKNESVTSFREEKQNTTENSCKTNESCADVSMGNISELLEDTRNKSTYSSNSVFEDISSIVDDSFVSEESDEDEMETSEYVPTLIFQSNKQDKQVKIIEDHLKTNEYVPTKISQSDDTELSKSEYVPTKIFQSDNKQEQAKTIDELSKDSSEDSNDDVMIEAEILEPASQRESDASSDAENEEPDKSLEERENYLVPSSEEESDEEEEEECEEIDEHVEDSEDNSSKREESEAGSENSSHSSDVIEIKSSSEESNEEVKLNTSEETAENEHREEEEEESEREETDNEESEDDVNVHEESEEEVSENEENENILEQNVEIIEEIEEIPIEVNVEIYEEDRELQMDTEQMEHDIQQVESDTTEEIGEVAEIQPNIDLREDFRLELEESVQEQDKSMEPKINEAEENKQEEEEMNQAVILESTETDIMDKEQKENEEKTQRNISQDCLETISFYQPNEEMHKTDILCSENLSNENQIQKIEMDEKLPLQEESYTSSKSSKRTTSKQLNVIEEETVSLPQKSTRKSEEKPADSEAKLSSIEKEPARFSTRRRSKSVDVEAISAAEDKSKVARSSTRRRSTSINIAAKEATIEASTKTIEEKAKPASIEEMSKFVRSSTRRRSTSIVGKTAEEKPVTKTSKRSTSVDIEAKPATTEASAKTIEEQVKPTGKTRKRSTSVDVDARPVTIEASTKTNEGKPATKTKKGSTSDGVEPKPVTIEASAKTIEEKPAARTRKTSTSVDVETKQATIEASSKTVEEPAKSATRTRRRSTSVDIEAKPATIIASAKTVEEKSATRTRRRSTSVDIEAKPATIEPVRSSTRRRSTSIVIGASGKTTEEEPVKPIIITRTRSTSVDVETKPATIEEETSKPVRSSTRRRSTSIVTEPTGKTTEEEPVKPTAKTRTRSTSVDVETKPATIEEESSKPVRSSTRRRSTSIVTEPTEEQVKPSTRTRTRSTSIDLETKPPLKEESTKPAPRTRKRSTSVDLEDVSEPKVSTPMRSTRASSITNLPVIEEEVHPPSRTTRASSVESSASQRSKRGSSPKKSPARRGRKRSIQTDVIAEESESISAEQSKRTALEDIPEKIEEYSATHRMTRSQKMIMEKSLKRQEMKKLEAKVAKPRVADFDPIILLDKESFSGSPDLDDRFTRSTSPSSSVSSAVTAEPHTPGRRGGSRRLSHTSTPRRSARSASTADDEEVCSVRSVPVVRRVPVVELDRMEVERHRSLSPTALVQESATPSSRGRNKSRRSSIFPVQTDLSKISEENSIEHEASPAAAASEATKDARPKRGRPRRHKTESQESQSSQSPDSQERKTSSKSRTSSYKPLEEYFPRYSAYSTRKTFKIKKLTRKSAQ